VHGYIVVSGLIYDVRLGSVRAVIAPAALAPQEHRAAQP
jgi:hypothetical protein